MNPVPVIMNELYIFRGLDLSAYYLGTRPSNEPPPIYDLYGVVNHHGGILGGHYTAFVRCPDAYDSKKSEVGKSLILYLIEMPFNAFANKADPDRAALVKLPDQALICFLLKYDTSDPTLLNLTDNLFVLCSKMKVYLYNYS